MQFEGVLLNYGRGWEIKVPPLDLTVVGLTEDHAMENLRLLVLECFESDFKPQRIKDVKVYVERRGNCIYLGCSETSLLMALSTRRQRKKGNLSLRSVAARLGVKPSTFLCYERGEYNISAEKYEKILLAANPKFKAKLIVKSYSF